MVCFFFYSFIFLLTDIIFKRLCTTNADTRLPGNVNAKWYNAGRGDGDVLRLQTIKAIVDSRSFKSLKSDEPRRVQVLDLYCLTRFESESSSREIVY